MTTYTCGWPGCSRAISWRDAFCYSHWRRIPLAERSDRVKRVIEDREETP